MRKISLVFMATALLVAGTVTANITEPADPANHLSSQIHKMLDKNTFDVQDDIIAQVRFTINKESEIVVLSVDTENTSLEAFVKRRLNYQRVELENAKEGKLYTIPVRITA